MTRNAQPAVFKDGETLWIIFILLATAAIHLSGAFRIGYISDDYDLLQRAPSINLLHPLWDHHFSIVITALFKLASAGIFPPVAWHSLALATHMLNTVLVFIFARIGLGMYKWTALVTTAIFAFAAAGYEALAWACSIGYVIVLPCILLGLLATLAAQSKRIWMASFSLAVLQFCALLIWDWGILLLPLACVSAFLWKLPRKEISIRQALLLLMPCAVVCCLMLVMKRSLGYQTGYHAALLNVLGGVKMLVAAPITNLTPNTTAAFLTSVWGMLCAGMIWLILSLYAVRNHVMRLALCMYLVCILPIILFGALQSRYCYIATPFIGIACVSLMERLPAKRLAHAALLLVITVHLVFAIERSQLWLGSYRAACAIKTAIKKIHILDGQNLVIVNIPDQYGPQDMIWRPFMWRNGLASFGRVFIRVNTPDCPFIWREGPVSTMQREAIALMYGHAAVYEVAYNSLHDYRQFVVAPLDPNSRITTGK